MSCYHPLRAIKISDIAPGDYNAYNPKTSKSHLRILKSTDSLCNHPMAFDLPCGKCIGCRLDKSREWANRCMLELQYHDSSLFLTLTYDDEHVPVSYYSDPSTGEAIKSYTLRLRDFQLFCKRLRRHVEPDKIRFFSCGEYGDNTMRPHYHGIFFGLYLNDLVYFGKNELGQNYYVSETLTNIWQNGFVLAADVSWETCAYVARYVTKKLSGPSADIYRQLNITPPFSLMSRKPGIGKQYYDDHPDVFDYSHISVSTPTGGIKFRPPKYFDRLYIEEHPELADTIRLYRKQFSDAREQIIDDHTTLPVDERHLVEEYNRQHSVTALLRDKL